MNWKVLFNPFAKYTEQKLALTGCLTIIAGIIIYRQYGWTNDGIYHSAPQPGIHLAKSAVEVFCYVLLPALLLLAIGKLINPKTRFFDILNAVMIHRAPMIAGILLIEIPFFKSATSQILDAIKNNALDSLPSSALWASSIMGIVMLLLLAYAIVLLVNGFRVAVYAKKPVHFVFFALALIFSEIIYRLLIYPHLVSL